MIIWKKMSLFHLENYTLQEVFLPKRTQLSHGNNVLNAAGPDLDGFH
jgi:hypothetical protein